MKKPVHFPNPAMPLHMFNHKGLDLFRKNKQESYKHGSMVCGCISKTILNEKWFVCLVTGLLGQDWQKITGWILPFAKFQDSLSFT